MDRKQLAHVDHGPLPDYTLLVMPTFCECQELLTIVFVIIYRLLLGFVADLVSS